ncbi:uracil-DNA glycosylase [Sphingomonas sp. NBWT7]|uniref:uracil-DNA glycosylase family protein n=1 Tax=Sphingomonas sp. NBWT7 TaxID=2596913 RepID=UPI00162705B9|nr:uracil-DNA glycosylase family protein [Sphingomonas sp. NBWT7]QNE31852.1 uracil-DNA glycosylase [Sphingomonas sp. NBWT7]
MGADQNHNWQALADSALEWWRDAGVDTLVGDAPFQWLSDEAAHEEAVASPAARAPAVSASALPAAALPATAEEFLRWRIGEAAPEAGWGGALVAASGPVTADLMVLIDCPERDAGDSLLGGAAGRLFDRMLAAIGRSRDDVHLASVCARRPTAGRMPRDLEARLSEIARHHAGLVAPKRLLVLGDAASRAILSANVMAARGGLHVLNHDGGRVTAVAASFHPRMLLERPALKAESWKDLQLLIGGLS